MSSVSVEVHGKRHTVHVSPMAPLSAVVAAAKAAAGGIAADPAACKLLLGKKELDLGTPLRFANLPTGAKLQLVTGQERRLGMGEPIAAPRLPESPTKAAGRSPRAADAAAAPYTMAPSSAQMTAAGGDGGSAGGQGSHAAGGDCAAGAVASQSSPTSPQAAGGAAAGSAPGSAPQQYSPAHPAANDAGTGTAAAPGSAEAAGSADAPGSAEEAGSGEAAGSAAAAAAAAADGGAPAVPQPDLRSAQLLGRPAFVFSLAAAQEAEAASSSAAASGDLPDSFYEFTADDYARVARGWGANAAGPPAHAPLKTAKLRAAEAAAAAEKAGLVPVRVLGFAGGLALQATFPATTPVSALQDLVVRAVPPGTAGLHLYTAPPKAVLQQPQVSLYEAGLAPAAVVYVGCGGGEAPALRPEVADLQGPPPSRERRPRGGRNGGKRRAAAEAAEGAGPSGAAAAPQQGGQPQAQEARSATGAKLPKWLKPKE